MLASLAPGAFSEDSFKEEFGTPRAWEQAGARAQEVSLHILEVVKEGVPHPTREDIDVALGRLMEKRARREARASGVGLAPERGELCRLCVELLDLPAPGTKAIPLESVSMKAAHLLQNFERLMLDPGGEALLDKAAATRAFEDSALLDDKSRMQLAARMWRGGMLVEIDEVLYPVSLFSVVKKTVSTESGWTTVQRLIFDNRRGNVLWRTPPWVPLCGPGPFSAIDASAAPEGWQMSGATGDVSNWYYRLAIPRRMASYFGLGGVSTRSLRA